MKKSSLVAFSLAIGLSSLATSAVAKPYKGAEVYALQEQLYGRIVVRMRMAKGSGLLSTFFLYKNGSEMPGAFWEEVDVEVLGKEDAKVWQSNIISGQPKKTSEELHPYATSLADGYHTYTVEWKPGSVRWLFDGTEVRHTEGGQADELTHAQGIRFNIWTAFAEAWVGPLDDAVLPQHQYVNWVEYYRYDEGEFVLDFRDEFDSFDDTRWGKANWTFAENRADFAPENVVVKDGTLVLSLTKEGATGFTGTVPLDDGVTLPVPPVVDPGTGGGAGAGNPDDSTGAVTGGSMSSGGGSAAPRETETGCSCRVSGDPTSPAAPAGLAFFGAAFVLARRLRRALAARGPSM